MKPPFTVYEMEKMDQHLRIVQHDTDMRRFHPELYGRSPERTMEEALEQADQEHQAVRFAP